MPSTCHLSANQDICHILYTIKESSYKLELLFRVALARNYPAPFYANQEKDFFILQLS